MLKVRADYIFQNPYATRYVGWGVGVDTVHPCVRNFELGQGLKHFNSNYYKFALKIIKSCFENRIDTGTLCMMENIANIYDGNTEMDEKNLKSEGKNRKKNIFINIFFVFPTLIF